MANPESQIEHSVPFPKGPKGTKEAGEPNFSIALLGEETITIDDMLVLEYARVAAGSKGKHGGNRGAFYFAGDSRQPMYTGRDESALEPVYVNPAFRLTFAKSHTIGSVPYIIKIGTHTLSLREVNTFGNEFALKVDSSTQFSFIREGKVSSFAELQNALLKRMDEAAARPARSK